MAKDCAALAAVLCDEVVLAQAVGEPGHARASVRMHRYCCVECGVRAYRTVLARAARALIHVHVAVACQQWVLAALHDAALSAIRSNIGVVAESICIPRCAHATI